MDFGRQDVHGGRLADLSFTYDALPPCDGSPLMVSSLTDAQAQMQAYDLLGQLVYYLLGDKDRHIEIKAEKGQLKVAVSTVVQCGQQRHRAVRNRTIDPQLPKPIKVTPELCREMGGAALATIYDTIRKAELSAQQIAS